MLLKKNKGVKIETNPIKPRHICKKKIAIVSIIFFFSAQTALFSVSFLIHTWANRSQLKLERHQQKFNSKLRRTLENL